MNTKVSFVTAFANRIPSLVAKRKAIFRLGIVMLLTQLLAVVAYGQPPSCTLGCNDNVQVSLDNANCRAEITVSMISPTAFNSCPGANFQVIVMDLNGNVINSSPFVTAADAKKKRIVKILDQNSGNNCWGSILVEDKLPPVFSNCNDQVLPCNADLNASGVVIAPTAIDNCSGPAALTWSDVAMDFPCSDPLYTAMITRTYTATDANGNTSSCSKIIYLTKGSLGAVDFPKNFDGLQQPIIDCTNANTDPSFTGVPTINGQPVNLYCDLIVSSTDQISIGCAGSKIINRTWQVVEWCSGNAQSMVQFIKVDDKVPPTMNCPTDVTIGTKATACNADYTFPNVNPQDNCSPTNLITLQYSSSKGVILGNTVQNLPIGVTTVSITETDNCGNKTICTYNITVRDDSPPVAVCSGLKNVSLGLDGKAELTAASFDDGSVDNCGIDRFEISRFGTTVNFLPKIIFDCNDCNDTIMVVMRVWDSSGNFNDCMTSVYVDDKLAPKITCPANVTLNCTVDYKNLTLTGNPTASDNCSVTTAFSDQVNLNNCGIGSVTRTWTATDKGGRTSACTQVITIVNPKVFFINANDPLDPNDDVVWPNDFAGTTCGPSLLPAVTGSPVISSDVCSQISVTFEDTEMAGQGVGCKVILRKWIVVDFCQFNPNINPNPGYWEYTQRINITNNIPPAFSFICEDITLGLNDQNCVSQNLNRILTASDDCTATANLIWFVTVDLGNDNTIDRTLATGDISGAFPLGLSTVNATVSDGCGNNRNCIFRVNVLDVLKPTAVCINGLSTNVGANGIVTLDAKMFDGGSNDNCTSTNELTLNIVPTTFSCNLIGPNLVTFTVTDKGGNTDVCTTFVDVQDQFKVCPTNVNKTAAIAGAIMTAQDLGVEKVDIMMNGAISQISTTNAGNYMIYKPVGNNYVVKPEKTGDELNGVTTFDVVRMTRHILGLDKITNPYTLIAADVNKNGTISSADIVAARRVILGLSPKFAATQNSWRFVKKDFVFTNPLNPFASPFPELNIVSLNSDLTSNFVAIKIGDLNASAKPKSNTPAGQRGNAKKVQLFADNINLKSGKTYRVPLLIKDKDINGMQFTLKLNDKVSLTNIVTGNLSDMNASNIAVLDNNTITASWNSNTAITKGSTFAILEIMANENCALSDVLALNSEVTLAEAYDKNDESIDIELAFTNSKTTNTVRNIELYQNQPNPFNESTQISFFLPESTVATLQIMDINGRIIYTQKNEYNSGNHTININKNEMSNLTTGILYYQLQTPDQNITKKMIILE
ncbi:MAG: HYR domain-containing protein [Saprospiraceae bacterium]